MEQSGRGTHQLCGWCQKTTLTPKNNQFGGICTSNYISGKRCCILQTIELSWDCLQAMENSTLGKIHLLMDQNENPIPLIFVNYFGSRIICTRYHSQLISLFSKPRFFWPGQKILLAETTGSCEDRPWRATSASRFSPLPREAANIG